MMRWEIKRPYRTCSLKSRSLRILLLMRRVSMKRVTTIIGPFSQHSSLLIKRSVCGR